MPPPPTLQALIRSAPGEVIAPDTVRQVADEGMPVYGHPHVMGVLFVQFDVKFPERLDLTPAQRAALTGILPRGASEPAPEASLVAKELMEVDMEARKARERLAKDAYDSDEEAGGGGFGGAQRVQCAQQ